jgi:hypothetical protein
LSTTITEKQNVIFEKQKKSPISDSRSSKSPARSHHPRHPPRRLERRSAGFLGRGAAAAGEKRAAFNDQNQQETTCLI